MPYAGAVRRETVVAARTSALSGTATVATVTTIQGEGLESFDELLVYIVSSQSLVGTAPTMDLYLQRAVVPDPNPATDAHWADFFAFLQFTTSAGLHVTLPVSPTGASGGNTATAQDVARTESSMAARGVFYGHWGDRIRIREKMGGTVTQAMIYSIHMTGRIG